MANRTPGSRQGRPPTHGMSRTPTYETWCQMKKRCANVNDSYYGGRGIVVCSEWQTFEGFLADMGVRPDGTSIDRIDPDGNYEPSNCRWATLAEQGVNRCGRRGQGQANVVAA